jgi:hypothetical protein
MSRGAGKPPERRRYAGFAFASMIGRDLVHDARNLVVEPISKMAGLIPKGVSETTIPEFHVENCERDEHDRQGPRKRHDTRGI